MMESKLHTYFDNPERSSNSEIISANEGFKSTPIIQQLLDGFPEFAFILDDKRQVVASNKKVTNLPDIESINNVLGLRIGEVFKCTHHAEEPNGCGTTKFCALCGAAKTIRAAKKNSSISVEECRITSNIDDKETYFDLLVHSSPFMHDDKQYILFAVRDISDYKRRQVLERIFFHDVLNTSGSIQGLVSLLNDETNNEEKEELIGLLLESADQLINEITSQRDLLYAEEGELSVEATATNMNAVLAKGYSHYQNHNLAEDKIFEVIYLEKDIQFETDIPLLVRSLGNLIKNALEATPKGGTVKLYSSNNNDNVFIHVYNNGVIPENIQLQIFQRSFSTKGGKGRGIGTYSIKLIVEQYLKGQVYFSSNKENQTIFTIKLPIKIT